MSDIDLTQLAGISAWIAAVATVVGMATLLVFFARGGRWGSANDAASVVLMLALIPPAIVLALIQSEDVGVIAFAAAAVGIAAMLVAAILQALLVIGRVTYEQTKLAVLGLGAVVGAWYLSVAIMGGGTDLPDGLRIAAAASGAGFIAVAYGFARGGERHPASVVGGLVAFAASLLVQVWLGALLLGGSLTVPGEIG